MKEQDSIWRLISEKLAGELSEVDLQKLKEIQEERPGLTPVLQMLEKMWKAGAFQKSGDNSNRFEKHLERLAAKDDDYRSKLTSKPEL